MGLFPRFVPKNQSSFQKELKLRVNAYFKENNLSEKGGKTLLLNSIVHLSLYLVPLVLILMDIFPYPFLFLLGGVMGIGMAGVGMGVMHDALHGAFSEKKWVNTLMGSSIFILGGNIYNWKVQHNVLHHTFTNILNWDEDIDVGIVTRFSPQAELKPAHRFQHIYCFFLYGILTLNWITAHDFYQYFSYKKRKIKARKNVNYTNEFILLISSKIVYYAIFMVLPIYLTSLTFWSYLPVFVFSHVIAGLILGTVFSLAHVVEGAGFPEPDSEGNINMSWQEHQVRTTCNFSTESRFLAWYCGGLNFQIEHHLFPNISHIHYPEISKIVSKTLKDYGLPYNMEPTFFSALKSHVTLLKLYGKGLDLQH